VPDVLVSGDHEKVRAWRVEQSRARAEHFEKDSE
jgi:tRNA G37 N-methylase TrmD